MENKKNQEKTGKIQDTSHRRLQNARPTLGLLLEHTLDLDYGYHDIIMAGATAAAQEQDINLICFVGGALQGKPGVAFSRQRNILYELASADNLDGLIVLSTVGHHVDFEDYQAFFAGYHPLPTVSIGASIPGVPSFVVDNEQGMRQALIHLIEDHGYRRIAFIRGPDASLEAQARYRVYTDVLASYGLPLEPDLVVPGTFRINSGIEAIRILLEQRQVSFEAVVAANDNMALGAMEALQARQIDVPADVALVGFDDVKQARYALPSLTTLRQPIFELSKQAVEFLVRRLTQDERIPDRIELPTKLIKRRSCGCLDYTTAQEKDRDIALTDEAFLQQLISQRQSIEEEMTQAIWYAGVSSPDWPKQLLDAFIAELRDTATSGFISALAQILPQATGEDDISWWFEVLATLRNHLDWGNDAASWQAEALLQQAQVFINEKSRKVLMQQHVQRERQNVTLHEIGQSLITMFDVEKLMDLIAEGITRLGIPSGYVALFEEPRPYRFPQSPPEWSRLLLACNENERFTLEPDGLRFRSRELLPAQFFPQNRRYTMMVEALHFRNEQIGFALLEAGPPEGHVYETLRAQISNGLKGTFLSKAQKEAEAALRQHRDHLDELVQERTVELAASNESLRREIEERKQVDEALRKSEEKYRSILEEMEEGYWEVDLAGNFTFFNKTMCQFTGYSPEELMGMNNREYTTPETAKAIFQLFNQVYQTGQMKLIEDYEIIAKGGRKVILEGSVSLKLDPAGQPIGFRGITRDVTDRKQAETALRESEENLQATLNSIGDAVIATDTQSHVVRMNPVAEHLTGWKFEEARGKPLNEVFHIVNSQAEEAAVNPVKKVLEKGEIVGLANHTMLLARNGRQYQIADSAAPIKNDEEQITGVVLVFRDVTHDYRMQKALQESESHLRAIFETIPDLIWLKDTNGVFLACNSRLARLYGAQESEILGKTDYDFVDKELADYFTQKDREAIAAGKPVINEEEVTYADSGQTVQIETIKTPVYDPEGELIGTLGIARDISERKRAEEELIESKQMLSNVLNTIPVRVFWKDLNGVFLGCNQLFAQDVGKNSPEEVIGTDDYDLGNVEQAEMYRKDDKYVIESGQPKINYEEPQINADGNFAWLNTSKIPLRDSNGEVYGILGTYEDITERKAAAEALQRSQQNLAYAQKIAKLGYYYWDLHTNEVVWSDEMYQIFGVDQATYLPSVEAFSQFIHPDDLNVFFGQDFAKSINQKTNHMEFRIFDQKSAAFKYLDLWTETTFDDEGNPERVFGIVQDNTERRQAEIKLETYTAELERSNRELQEYAYIASHDLQEPLRKIQTFGDRLQQKYHPVLDKKGRDYLERMQNAAARMQALIVDLLSFSRVRTHTQPFAEVNLQQTVWQVLQDLELKISEAKAEIVVDRLPVIEADPSQMYQLFQNLLSNALKFRRSDGKPKIIIQNKSTESLCQISIIDNGIGFEEKYVDRIFTVFERLHSRDEYPGTGIGLAICRGIVERHRGSIRAVSKPNQGSTFIVSLPVKQS